MRRQSIFELGHSSARLIAQKANSQRSTSSHAAFVPDTTMLFGPSKLAICTVPAERALVAAPGEQRAPLAVHARRRIDVGDRRARSRRERQVEGPRGHHGVARVFPLGYRGEDQTFGQLDSSQRERPGRATRERL